MNKNTNYNVLNRSGSTVVYSVEDDNGRTIRRQFSPGESRSIPYWELEKLTYQPGGSNLIANYLLIKEEEVLDGLNIDAEVEYYMSKSEILELLTSGSLDAFLDALDFAPMGVIQLIKDLAVELPLNDVQKRQALKEKTGFDVDRAVANVKADKSDDAEVTSSKRRVQPVKSETPARRAETTSKYKIVSTQE